MCSMPARTTQDIAENRVWSILGMACINNKRAASASRQKAAERISWQGRNKTARPASLSQAQHGWYTRYAGSMSILMASLDDK